MEYLIFSTTLSLIFASTLLADLTGEAQYKHPIIKQHGGIVALPEAAHQPAQNSKVLLDITSDKQEGGVLLGFDRAALILNQYTEAGAGIENGLKMAIVLHGPATKAALSNDGYARHTNSYHKNLGKSQNPNLKLIGELKKAGVDVFVCGQALAHHGYASTDVAPEVTMAVSAATVNINLQMDGYVYIPFK